MKSYLILILLVTATNLFANDQTPDLEVQMLEKGIYLHRSFKNVEGYGLVDSNGLVVIDGEDAYIVDTPWTDEDTEKLAEWIDEQGFVLKGSISTHSHQDRVGGLGWLNAHSIPTYASTVTNELLKKNGKEMASHTFSQSEQNIGFANNILEVYYPGAGHTIDNLVVWLPTSKILVGGCFIKGIESENLGYIGEASISAWPNSIDNLKSRYPEAKVVIPGHGRVGNLALLDHTKELADTSLKK
ncbi:UNVERIFIED_CONTAM: hypothetical protein GTU68_037908 [Idotea baltica]|nr:hypothetical protein [Idotea baltica]